MLAVVLAAGLFPNVGTVQAKTSCPYGVCPSSSSSGIPAWEIAAILIIIIAGVIAATLFLMRRRRPPPATSVAGGTAGPAEGAGPAGGAAAPPYLETAEDVGHAPPSVIPPGVVGAAGAAGAAGATAGAGAGSDIDSLMAELDKISGEILKKPPKKGPGAKDSDVVEDVEKSP